MNEQKVSVETRRVVITLSTGHEIEGEVFLQLYGVHQDGLQRIGEMVNGEEMFLPLRSDDGVELINLEQVISVSTNAEEEFDPLLKLGEEHHLQVETSQEKSLQLRIFVNLPGEKKRVKDFLNQEKRFLLFLSQGQVLYIAKKYLLRVKD